MGQLQSFCSQEFSPKNKYHLESTPQLLHTHEASGRPGEKVISSEAFGHTHEVLISQDGQTGTQTKRFPIEHVHPIVIVE